MVAKPTHYDTEPLSRDVVKLSESLPENLGAAVLYMYHYRDADSPTSALVKAQKHMYKAVYGHQLKPLTHLQKLLIDKLSAGLPKGSEAGYWSAMKHGSYVSAINFISSLIREEGRSDESVTKTENI